MEEAAVLNSGEEDTETEGRYLPAVGEDCLGALAISEEAEEFDMEVEQEEDDTRSVTTSLLRRQRQQQQRSARRASEMRPNRQAGTLSPTDGADRRTSVLRELEFDDTDQAQRGEGVESSDGSSSGSSSGSTGHECPICREPFHSQGGDKRTARLNCGHTLCHRCLAGILRRARDPSRVQCPFCRQSTPSLRWEILKMQEESYGDSVYTVTPPPASSSSPGTVGPDGELTRLPGPHQAPPPPPPASCCGALERRLESRTQTRVLCGCCVHPACLVRILRLMRRCFFCCSM